MIKSTGLISDHCLPVARLLKLSEQVPQDLGSTCCPRQAATYLANRAALEPAPHDLDGM